MSLRLASLMIISLFSVALLAAPVLGFSVSSSTGDGNGVASSDSKYTLHDSASLTEETTLIGSNLQKSLQASCTGNNEISQQMTSSSSSSSSSLQSSVSSQGSLDISSAGYASASSASLGVGVAGQGDLSLSGLASQGQAETGQEAGVVDGLISTSQSLSAGQGAASSQSTAMAGAAGYVGTGAFSQENAMVAAGSFIGAGEMQVQLSASVSEKAQATGQASLDGVTWLDSSTFQAISEGNRGLSVEGLRELPDGVGTVQIDALNMDRDNLDKLDSSGGVAVENQGGSYSSFALTGRRRNGANPQVQLYFNPSNRPSGMDEDAAKNCIAAAANTWDDAVAKNIFADGQTVIKDDNLGSDYNDYKNVNLFGSLDWGILGQATTWYGGPVVDGYSTIYDTDIVYNKDRSWTTDLNTAISTGKIDLQSVAVHELGHSIGMGDIYYPKLSYDDPRTKDYEQVMNAYNGPQRMLGNGDSTGARILYGRLDESKYIFRMWNPYITDHLYTTSYNEYSVGAINCGYGQEGIIGLLSSTGTTGTVPLYRMWNPYITDHLYTTNYDEYLVGAINCGYSREGTFAYIYNTAQAGAIPLYRMWNPYITDHLYTTNYNEYLVGAVNCGYSREGIVGYIKPLN